MQTSKDGFLALDFGTKKVGLAVSHGFMGEALKSIPFRGNEEKFYLEIERIVKEQGIGIVVIGLPLEDGRETKQSSWTREQAMLLSKRITCEIEFVDESYTSLQAIDNLSGAGDIDSESAKIILEQYLEDSTR